MLCKIFQWSTCRRVSFVRFTATFQCQSVILMCIQRCQKPVQQGFNLSLFAISFIKSSGVFFFVCLFFGRCWDIDEVFLAVRRSISRSVVYLLTTRPNQVLIITSITALKSRTILPLQPTVFCFISSTVNNLLSLSLIISLMYSMSCLFQSWKNKHFAYTVSKSCSTKFVGGNLLSISYSEMSFLVSR